MVTEDPGGDTAPDRKYCNVDCRLPSYICIQVEKKYSQALQEQQVQGKDFLKKQESIRDYIHADIYSISAV